MTFDDMVAGMKTHFETTENRKLYMTVWRTTTFAGACAETENLQKTRLECMEIMLTRLALCQQALIDEYSHGNQLRDVIITVCNGIAECRHALLTPADTYEGVASQLRSAIGTLQREVDLRNTNPAPMIYNSASGQ